MAEDRPHNFLDNYGRPDMKLPYRWNDDTPLSLPLGPKNVHVTSPYLIGVIDIRWDSPTLYAEHNGLEIQGVNIYKSYDTPEGPFTLLNPTPAGALYYRDQTREVYVNQEDPTVGGRIIAGTNATGDWVVKTYYKPIVIAGTNGEIAESWKHVRVEIKVTSNDSYVTVPAWRVVGETGEIFLIKDPIYNNTTNRIDPAILPNFALGGQIRVSYTYVDNRIQTDIARKIYYRLTTVAKNRETNEVRETPITQTDAVSLYDMEKIDWIWAEAIRRNMWILQQGGERVKVFIRKWSGVTCRCWDYQYLSARQDCLSCMGTGIVGGYEGPIDLIVAPPEAEKTIQLLDLGMHISYDWNSWTSPYPLLNDRDFIVRQNNDRFSIAHINPQGSRGAIYQQHFMLSPLDQKDIRYKVPIDGGQVMVPQAWNAYRQPQPSDAAPVIPVKPESEIPGQYQRTGRTVTFENICYIFMGCVSILNEFMHLIKSGVLGC